MIRSLPAPWRVLTVTFLLLPVFALGHHLARALTSLPHTASDPWGTNEQVNAVSGQLTANPAVAVDPSGNVYVVWQDFRNSGTYGADIYFNMRSAATGLWLDEDFRVNTDVISATQSAPDIAVDANGNAYVVWTDLREKTDSDIYLRVRHSNGDWGTEEQVNSASEGLVPIPQESPAVAVSPTGALYVVWLDHRKVAPHVFFRERSASGGWEGAEVDLTDDPIATGRCFPDVAANTNGDVYVVWYEPCTDPNLYFRAREGGTWRTSEQVDDIQHAGPWNVSPPAVGVDDAGSAYAVWTNEQGNYYTILADIRPAATGQWGDDVMVTDLLLTEQGYPDIAVTPSGFAWVAWHDMRNDTGNIYTSWSLGGSWSANIRVNDDDTLCAQTNPAIAVDPSGNGYVVWVDGRNFSEDNQRDIYFSMSPFPLTHPIFLPLAVRNHG